MSISLQQLQIEDEAHIQQAKESREAEESKPKPDPYSIFTADLGSGSVSAKTFYSALAYADGMSRGAGTMYKYVRHHVVIFFGGYKEGNPLHDACARMSIPLLGLARALDHIGYAATTAQARADGDDKSPQPTTVRLVDAYGLLQHAQRELIGALKAANPELVHVFINFLHGGMSEHDRAREFMKDVPDVDDASLLGVAADVIKEGAHSLHSTYNKGASSTDDFVAKTTRERLGGAVHVREHAPGKYHVVSAEPGALGAPKDTEEGQT